MKSNWHDSTYQPEGRTGNCTQHAGIFNKLVGSPSMSPFCKKLLCQKATSSQMWRQNQVLQLWGASIPSLWNKAYFILKPQQFRSCSTDIQSLWHKLSRIRQAAGKNNCFLQLLTCSQIWVRVLKLRAQRDWFETGSLETPITHEVKVINKHIISGCALPMGVHGKKITFNELSPYMQWIATMNRHQITFPAVWYSPHPGRMVPNSDLFFLCFCPLQLSSLLPSTVFQARNGKI